MAEAMETVINQDAVKALANSLTEPAQQTSEAGRKEYVRITWTDKKDPDMHDCFFAFGDDQFHAGLKRFGLEDGFKDGSVKIKSAGMGLYGTQEGLDRYFSDLRDITKANREEIREKCTPQDVYNVEYVNYECMYDWDGDRNAIERVVFWFGEDAARKILRRGFNAPIEGVLERLRKQ